MNNEMRYALDRLRCGDITYLQQMDDCIEYKLFEGKKHGEIKEYLAMYEMSKLQKMHLASILVSLLTSLAFAITAPNIVWQSLAFAVVVYLPVSYFKNRNAYENELNKAKRCQVLYQLLGLYTYDTILDCYHKAHPEFDPVAFKREKFHK